MSTMSTRPSGPVKRTVSSSPGPAHRRTYSSKLLTAPIFLLALAAASPRPVNAATYPLPCDEPVTATIDTLLDNDFFTFTAQDGEIVTITVVEDATAPPDFFATWRLLDGSGLPVDSCSFFTTLQQKDCGPLSEAGETYSIQVQEHTNSSTGSYWIHLQRLDPKASCDYFEPSCSTEINNTIDHFIDNDLFSFCATDETIFSVTITKDPGAPPEFHVYWRLIDGTGVPASDCGYFTTENPKDCGPLSEAGMPYRLQVQEFTFASPGDYSLFVAPLGGSCIDCPAIPIFADGFEPGDTSAWSSAVQ